MPGKTLSKQELEAVKRSLEKKLAEHQEELTKSPQPGKKSVFESLLALVTHLITLAEDNYSAVSGDPAAEAVLVLLCDSLELASTLNWNSYWSMIGNVSVALSLQARSKELVDQALEDFLKKHLAQEHRDLYLTLFNFGLPEKNRVGSETEKKTVVPLTEAIDACRNAQGILAEKGIAPSPQLQAVFDASLAQQRANQSTVAPSTAEGLKKDKPADVELKRQRRVMLLTVFLQCGVPDLGLGDIVSANQGLASPDQEGDPLTIEDEHVTPVTTTVSTAPDTTPATPSTTTALTTNALSAAEQQQADETRQVTAGVEHILTTLIEEEEEHLGLLTTMSNTLTQLTDDLTQRIDAAKRHVLVANKQLAVVRLLLGDGSDEDVERQLIALMYNDPLRIEAANRILQALYRHWYAHESYVLAGYLYPKPDWQGNSTLLVGELMAYRRHPRTCEAVEKGAIKECARIDSEYQEGEYITTVKPLEKQVQEMKTVQAGIVQAVANANEHQQMLAGVKNDKGRIREIVGELQQQKTQYVTGWFNAVIAWFSKDYKAIRDSIRTVCEAAEAVVTAGNSEDVTADVNKVLAASDKIIQLERALEDDDGARPRSRFAVRRFVQNRVRTRVNRALKSTVAPTTTVASLFQSKTGEKREEYGQAVEQHRAAAAAAA